MDEAERHLQLLRTSCSDLQLDRVRTDRGQFNDILIVNDEFVFRFPRSSEAARTLHRELAILDAIRGQVSLPVPVPIYRLLDPQTGEPVFIGYRMIAGEPLWRDTLAGISDEAVHARLAGQLAMFLRDLHRIPSAAIPVDLPVAEDAAYWTDLYARIREHLFPYMRPDARDATMGSFERYLADPRHFSFRSTLRHGDFGASNILFDPEAPMITGVIDFGSAGPGDPAQDVGGVLASYGQVFVERMYAVYPEIESMLDRARFYVGTYALQQALYALRNGDRATFEDGIADYV